MKVLDINGVIQYCDQILEKMEAYAKANDIPEENIVSSSYREHYLVKEWLEELKQYRNLDEQGKILVLPHGIGKPCYVLEKCKCGLHYNCRLSKKATAKSKAIVIKKVGNDRAYNLCMKIFERPFKVDYFKKIGKTVFLTKEEVDAALAKMESEV